MIIKTFPVGAFQCNCVIAADEVSREAILIDPGDEASRICDTITEAGFDVKYIIHTHAHLDHVGATAEVHKKLKGQVCLHKDDMPLYENMAMQAEFLGVPYHKQAAPQPTYISQGDVLECQNNLKAHVIHTPGHTPGSVCFAFDKLLISGDTLFKGSIGRTDLWGGDHPQILASIREKIFTLPQETVVIPGHGPQTTIGYEVQANPFFK